MDTLICFIVALVFSFIVIIYELLREKIYNDHIEQLQVMLKNRTEQLDSVIQKLESLKESFAELKNEFEKFKDKQ